MKKHTILFNLVAVMLCGLTTPASADFCGQSCNDCCEWSMLDGKVTVGADWLYWKVQQDGLLPGITATGVIGETESVFTTRSHRPNFKWDNGFRVNLGYEMPCDSWDLNLSYTYMPAKASVTSVVAEGDITFTPAPQLADFAPVFPSNTIVGMASKWNLTANNVDLDIGRTVSFGENLTVRPHVGFRATWFDQKYRSVIALTPGETTVSAVALSLKEKFQGYGVEAGLWTDYKLGCGLSLVGHFGGSILYSRFNVTREGALTTTVTIGDQPPVVVSSTLIRNSETLYTATPSLDYFVGLQYADTLCDMLFKARLGFEQHVLFDTNRFLSSGNLSTQGLTLGLDVGF